MGRNRSGLTVLELLISASLFLLALTIIGQLAVLGMRSKVTTEDKNVAFRSGTVALDELNRDLGHCEVIYSPSAFTTAHPGQADAPLIFRTISSRTGSAQPAVVSYRLDKRSRILERAFYDVGFDPAVSSSQVLAAGETSKALAPVGRRFCHYCGRPRAILGNEDDRHGHPYLHRLQRESRPRHSPHHPNPAASSVVAKFLYRATKLARQGSQRQTLGRKR